MVACLGWDGVTFLGLGEGGFQPLDEPHWSAAVLAGLNALPGHTMAMLGDGNGLVVYGRWSCDLGLMERYIIVTREPDGGASVGSYPIPPRVGVTSDAEEGVPGLADLPVVGSLFSASRRSGAALQSWRDGVLVAVSLIGRLGRGPALSIASYDRASLGGNPTHESRTASVSSLPALCASPRDGVALAYTAAEGLPRGGYLGTTPTPGPILLVTSPDGEEWSEPMPTVDEEKAHSSALAFDEELGLVLVYTAEREDGWPVFAARSQDFGQTWGEPVMLTEPGVRCLRPDALIHDGTLYVAYLTVPKDPPEGRGPRALANPDGAFVLTMDPAELPVG
ncbi:MAG: hypothetical protein GF320_05070 [Armatimonadia bacterium]|nr:hypothetical protein [Armatimonadia bacterium]